MSSLDQARALLQGSYDLHIHPIPSHVPRLLDDFEVLAQAEEAGMAGVLLKNHYEPTGARAILANRRGEGFRAKAYGAAVLNWPLGGLNPYAVHSALKMGAHVILYANPRRGQLPVPRGYAGRLFPAGGHQPTG